MELEPAGYEILKSTQALYWQAIAQSLMV